MILGSQIWQEYLKTHKPELFGINRMTPEETFKEGLRIGLDQAIRALRDYREDSEEVTACLHSREWAQWLEKNRSTVLGQ